MTFRPIPGVSLHARERAVLRLGGDPPREEWLAAVRSILDREAPLLAKQVDHADLAEVYLVTLRGRSVQVLWIPSASHIVTLVTPGEGMLRAPTAARHRSGALQKRRNRPERQPYHRARTQQEDWR